MPGRTREAGPEAWRLQGFGVSRDMRSEAAEGAASVQHGERRDGTER